MLKRSNLTPLSFLLFLMLCSGLGCQKKKSPISGEGPIRVGEVLPKTGADAAAGMAIHRGVELRIKEVNAAGGLQGRRVEVISLDDRGKAEESAVAATKLSTQDQVLAVIGTLSSSGSLAMAPILQYHKIPMIAPTATHPALTGVGDFIFRVCFTDPYQGQILAKFALERLKSQRAAVLYDIKSDYSVGLSQVFMSEFKKLGGQIVGIQTYAQGDLDFKSQLTYLRAKQPDLIFLPNYYTDSSMIARQLRELKIETPLLGGDAWDSPKLLEIGGKALEGSYFSNHYSNTVDSPDTQKFVQSFQKEYHSLPDGQAALGYDAAGLLMETLRKIQPMAPGELRGALAQIKGYAGITGKITMDSNRNPIKPAVIVKIEKGRFKFFTQME